MIKKHFLNTLYASNTMEEDTREKCPNPVSLVLIFKQETMKEVEKEHIIKKQVTMYNESLGKAEYHESEI